MERGKESQAKVTDAFSGDKKFYALVEIEPIMDKVVELQKRFERQYPELIEDITVKADGFDVILEDLNRDFDFWQNNTTYGEMTDSPAFHLVRKSTTKGTEALKSVKEFQKGELAMISELVTVFNTLQGALDSIASVVARQDNRIKYLEEERKVFLSLKEKIPVLK